MLGRSLRLIGVALALAVLAVPTQIGAAASGSGPVSLKTKHEYAKHSARFCGKQRRIRFFHRSQAIEYRGFLAPATGRHFAVKIVVKRCVRGRFVSVARYHFTGKKSGKFKGFSRAPKVGRGRHTRTGYFSARAFVNGQRSAKTYFAVTR